MEIVSLATETVAADRIVSAAWSAAAFCGNACFGRKLHFCMQLRWAGAALKIEAAFRETLSAKSRLRPAREIQVLQ